MTNADSESTIERRDQDWGETLDRLQGFIAARVGDPEIAADITQDILVRSIASGALDRVDNIAAWLYRAARNAAIDPPQAGRARRPGTLARPRPVRQPAQRGHPRARPLPATDDEPAPPHGS